MPLLNLLLTAGDGNSMNPNGVNKDAYDADDPSRSLEIINGHLDNANAPTMGILSFTPDLIRPGAYSRAGSVGQTTNLDYHTSVSREEDGAYSDNSLGTWRMIPGCATKFYVPTAGDSVLLTWQVSIATDRREDAYGSGNLVLRDDQLVRLQLVVDDVAKSSQVRDIPISVNDPGNLRYKERDRLWTGHYLMTSVSKGWHDAGIQIQSQANLTRVRTRNFKWIWFR